MEYGIVNQLRFFKNVFLRLLWWSPLFLSTLNLVLFTLLSVIHCRQFLVSTVKLLHQFFFQSFFEHAINFIFTIKIIVDVIKNVEKLEQGFLFLRQKNTFWLFFSIVGWFFSMDVLVASKAWNLCLFINFYATGSVDTTQFQDGWSFQRKTWVKMSIWA